MGWQPVKMKETGPSPFMREVISRCTAGIVALALLYGSYRCINKSFELSEDARQQGAITNPNGTRTSVRRSSGAGLPMILGIGLGGIGLFAFAGAVMPSSFFERFVRPPRDDSENFFERMRPL